MLTSSKPTSILHVRLKPRNCCFWRLNYAHAEVSVAGEVAPLICNGWSLATEFKKILASRARGVFNGMNAPGIGAVQMTSGRVACGAGVVQLPVGA